MSLEFVNVLTLSNYFSKKSKNICKKEYIDKDLTCTIYIEKDLFDADLLIGLETIEDTIKQLHVDIPRCIFHYNGQRYFEIPNNFPIKMMSYCTQCVMGIPFTILFDSIGNIYDGGEPMFVNAYDDEHVYIFKKLLLRNDNGSAVCNINVNVVIKKDEMVEFRFKIF